MDIFEMIILNKRLPEGEYDTFQAIVNKELVEIVDVSIPFQDEYWFSWGLWSGWSVLYHVVSKKDNMVRRGRIRFDTEQDARTWFTTFIPTGKVFVRHGGWKNLLVYSTTTR